MDLEGAFLFDHPLDLEHTLPVAADDTRDDEELLLREGIVRRGERLLAADHRGGMEEAGVVSRGADDRTEEFRAGIPVDDEVLVAGRIVATELNRPAKGGLGSADDDHRSDGVEEESQGNAAGEE